MPIIWKEELLFSGVSRIRKWVLRSIVKLVQSPFCRQEFGFTNQVFWVHHLMALSKEIFIQQNDQPATLPTIIEVKCPFTAKDKTIMEACSSVKDFFLVDNNGSLLLKTTHDYWHQIQGQLYLTGTECCDLMIWTTKDMQIVRIVKDKMWAPNISAMIDFYFMVFLESLK